MAESADQTQLGLIWTQQRGTPGTAGTTGEGLGAAGVGEGTVVAVAGTGEGGGGGEGLGIGTGPGMTGTPDPMTLVTMLPGGTLPEKNAGCKNISALSQFGLNPWLWAS